MADEVPKVIEADKKKTVELAARSICFIDSANDPYLSLVTTEQRHVTIRLSTLQIALLSQETSKFSAEKIREALAKLDHR